MILLESRTKYVHQSILGQILNYLVKGDYFIEAEVKWYVILAIVTVANVQNENFQANLNWTELLSW